MLLSRLLPSSPSPAVSTSLFSTSASLFLPCSWIYQYHFSRFHIYGWTYDICFSLSDLLHSVWQTLSPSTSLQMSQFRLKYPIQGGAAFKPSTLAPKSTLLSTCCDSSLMSFLASTTRFYLPVWKSSHLTHLHAHPSLYALCPHSACVWCLEDIRSLINIRWIIDLFSHFTDKETKTQE